MADKVVTVTYKRGAYVVVEGEKCTNTFFIIQEGSIVLTRTLDIGLEKEVLGAGDFFEVESGLTGKKRLCTAVAQSDCTIIIVPQNMYDVLIQKRPALVQKIVLAFSRRMRALDYILAKISLKHMGSDASSGAEQLYEIGEYYEHEEQIQPAAYAFYHYIKQYPDGQYVSQAQERYDSLVNRLPEELRVFDNDVTQTVRTVLAGNMIFAEAMLGHAMYFIQSGNVKICKMANNNELVLAVLNKGDMFGEMALLESKPRSASAIATADCTLLVITHQNFPTIVQRQPKLITRITTVIAERIWFVYRQIANAVIQGGEERLFDGLVMFMERNGYSDENVKSPPFNINLTLQEFVDHVGMEGRIANPIIQNFIDNKIIRLEDRKIVIISPQFVVNRVTYFKSLQNKNKKKQ